jgi:hypothetical protein
MGVYGWLTNTYSQDTNVITTSANCDALVYLDTCLPITFPFNREILHIYVLCL